MSNEYTGYDFAMDGSVHEIVVTGFVNGKPVTIICTPDGQGSFYKKFRDQCAREQRQLEIYRDRQGFQGIRATQLPRDPGKSWAGKMVERAAPNPKEVAEARRRALLGPKQGRW